MEFATVATIEQLQAALAIRREVFVREQGVPPEIEIDRYDRLDGPCRHVLVYYDGKPAGTGRIRAADGAGKLERICVLAQYRQYGLGQVVVQTLEQIAAAQGLSRVKLHGQTQAEGFYAKLGYRASSDVFMEDGIPHVLMTKELPAPTA